jgi:hypothetical protein
MKRFLAILIGITAVSSVSAEVVINNLASSSSGTRDASVNGSYYNIAVKFTASGSFNSISDLKLNLWAEPSGGNIARYNVTLMSSTGTGDSSVPNAVVDTLASNRNWSALGSTNDSFLTLTNITLGGTRAAGDYWISVTSDTYALTLNWGIGQATSAKNLNATSNSASGGWVNRAATWNDNNLGASITTNGVAVP